MIYDHLDTRWFSITGSEGSLVVPLYQEWAQPPKMPVNTGEAPGSPSSGTRIRVSCLSKTVPHIPQTQLDRHFQCTCSKAVIKTGKVYETFLVQSLVHGSAHIPHWMPRVSPGRPAQAAETSPTFTSTLLSLMSSGYYSTQLTLQEKAGQECPWQRSLSKCWGCRMSLWAVTPITGLWLLQTRPPYALPWKLQVMLKQLRAHSRALCNKLLLKKLNIVSQ